MILSCGVIIINSNDQILGCKPFGKKHNLLDIPKGRTEEGETPLETAIRETREEAGIDLTSDTLEDLGEFYYTTKKRLHLFKTNKDVDLSTLTCTSYFVLDDEEFPEVCAYEWIEKSDIINRFYKSLAPILVKILTEVPNE